MDKISTVDQANLPEAESTAKTMEGSFTADMLKEMKADGNLMASDSKEQVRGLYFSFTISNSQVF